MINDVLICKRSELHGVDRLFSLPVSRLIPKEWQLAAAKAKDHTTAFSKILNLPARQLLQQCRRRFHCTTWTLLNHLQMLAAIELLQKTAHGNEVSLRLGFKSPASFERRFKAYFGLTTIEFVRRGGVLRGWGQN
jgi:AraC-like DNA-binding protein